VIPTGNGIKNKKQNKKSKNNKNKIKNQKTIKIKIKNQKQIKSKNDKFFFCTQGKKN
jgi:hypothetical protein